MDRSKLAPDSTQVLNAIVLCLNQLLLEQSCRPLQHSSFDVKTAPSIPMADYLRRIHRYMNCSAAVFVNALALVDRLQQYNPEFSLNQRNIHRLLLAANVVSAKYLDDEYYKNTFYANVGGVPLKILNQIQIQFLQRIGWNCHIEAQTISAYLQRLQDYQQVHCKANIEQTVQSSKDEQISKQRKMPPNKLK